MSRTSHVESRSRQSRSYCEDLHTHDAKADLATAFVERCLELLRDSAVQSRSLLRKTGYSSDHYKQSSQNAC